MLDKNTPWFCSAAAAALEAQQSMDIGNGHLSRERKTLKERIAINAGKGMWEATIITPCLGTAEILKKELTDLGYYVKVKVQRVGSYSLTAFWFPSDHILKLLSQFDEDEGTSSESV